MEVVEEFGEFLKDEQARRYPSRSMCDLGREIWQTCEEKGFNEPVSHTITHKALRLLLIISEVTEALDELRHGRNEHEEIADAIIRLLHYGADTGMDIDREVLAKMEKNRGRPYKHGKKF